MKSSASTLLFVLLCEVNHIASSTDDDRSPGFLFDNHPGYILSLPVNVTNVKQMTTKVSNKMDCVFACVGAPWCRSVNFKITPEMDDHHICELIATENYTNPKHMKHSENFIHLNIKNPCEDKPCQNKGKCIPHNNRLDYRCRCKKGYTGGNCQNDIDECISESHGCHGNALCINSPGSFACQCKTGFTGNGKVCTDIDECASIQNLCDQNGACNNTAGSYQCTCNRGYYGNGAQCTPYPYRGLASSAILSSRGNADYIRTLSGYLHPVIQSSSRSRWVRCWRAASDGWDTASTFHTKCDGKGPTVTIVRVGSYVFGGYTDQSWHGNGAYSQSSRSFMYTLYNSYGYKPAQLTLTGRHNNAHAIYRNSVYGPTFGGHDLYISNDASRNTNSHTYLGHTYHCPPGSGSYQSSYCQSALAGSYNFTPTDVEVFYETTS